MKKTIDRLHKQLDAHQEQVAAIVSMQEVLAEFSRSGKLPSGTSFEVHIQCYKPDQRSIRTSAASVCQAYDEAVALWKEHNAKLGGCGRAELFVCTEALLVAVSWVDAVQIANSENTGMVFSSIHFGVDDRLVDEVSKTVWRIGEELPGWHANKFTKHKTAEVVTA
jgi:hypothetical protein